MEVGFFTEFQCPAGMAEATAFDESMAQMRAAEELGRRGVAGRAPLPEGALGPGLAARGRRRPRQAAPSDQDRQSEVLPRSHPAAPGRGRRHGRPPRRGRLDFGVGRSGLPGHYQDSTSPTRRAATASSRPRDPPEGVDAGPVLHDGRYYQFRDVCVIPKPYQKPHPRSASPPPPRRRTCSWVASATALRRGGGRTRSPISSARSGATTRRGARRGIRAGRGGASFPCTSPRARARPARSPRRAPCTGSGRSPRRSAARPPSTGGAGRAAGGGLVQRDPGRAGGLRDAGRGCGAPPHAARGAGILQPVGLMNVGGQIPTPACSARCASSRSAFPRLA